MVYYIHLILIKALEMRVVLGINIFVVLQKCSIKFSIKIQVY